MTTQPSNSIRSKFARTVVDIGTAGLSLVFGVAACNAGIVEGGVAAAALSLPLYHSVANILLRYPEANTVTDREYIDTTGLHATGKALKVAFKDAKGALAMATIVGFVGLTVGVLNKEMRALVETQKYHQLVNALPTLPLDTVVKPGTRAADICVNRFGKKITNGQEIAYRYNAVEYKVVCK